MRITSKSKITIKTGEGFTLVEIAIALGIIGFALVAIIGILPAGLQVQRDNKEDTIINQEGAYLMEAIRNGAQEMEHLNGLIEFVEVRQISDQTSVATLSTNANDLVSYLSRPSDIALRNPDEPLEIRAIMRPSSGSAVESVAEVGFRYQLVVRNVAFTNAATNFHAAPVAFMPGHLREIRLEFRWPVLPGDKVGSGRQVFRSLIAGTLVPHQTDPDRWLFQQ